MQLYFLRHGQSINNANWNDTSYVESPDPILTEAGILQASLTAEHLEQFQPLTNTQNWNVHNRHGYGITHIYTSLMERAAHTASFIARRLSGVPFRAWEEIHESGGIHRRDTGKRLEGLPGRSRVWFEANIPELTLPATLDGSGWWNRPFETEEECHTRAQRVWSEALARHRDLPDRDEHRILLVSHGGFFMHFMCAILDLPWKNASYGLRSWFLLNNCSLTRLDVRKDEVTLCYHNRTDHLPPHLVT